MKKICVRCARKQLKCQGIIGCSQCKAVDAICNLVKPIPVRDRFSEHTLKQQLMILCDGHNFRVTKKQGKVAFNNGFMKHPARFKKAVEFWDLYTKPSHGLDSRDIDEMQEETVDLKDDLKKDQSIPKKVRYRKFGNSLQHIQSLQPRYLY